METEAERLKTEQNLFKGNFRPIINLVKRIVKRELVNKYDYTEDQADQAISKIGDGKILAWIKEHKHQIFAVIKIILTLILMFAKEPPIK